MQLSSSRLEIAKKKSSEATSWRNYSKKISSKCSGIGINFPDTAMDQFNNGEPWEFVPNANIEGGHYIPCLSGDTKISLLNGTEMRISDLVGTEQWIYSIDKNGFVVPAKATNIRCTKSGASLIRVHLDNGSNFDCTIDHLIMLRDGRYAEAGYVQPGDSLMPLYRRLSKHGYEEIRHPRNGKWQLTHRAVARPEEHGIVVHHADFNKRNNCPENLRLMSWEDHTKLHADLPDALASYARSEQGRDKSRDLMRNNWANSGFRVRHDRHLRTNAKLAAHRKSGFYDREAQSANGKKTGPINFLLTNTPAAIEKRIKKRRLMYEADAVYRAKIVETARTNGGKSARLTVAQAAEIKRRIENGSYGIQAQLAAE